MLFNIESLQTTLRNDLCKLEKWTYNEKGIKRDQSGVASLGKQIWSLTLLSLVRERSLFLSLFLGAGRAQLVKCSHQEVWGSMGSCGLSGHLAAFSVSGSGADMSPSSGQKPPLSILTKKHTES